MKFTARAGISQSATIAAVVIVVAILGVSAYFVTNMGGSPGTSSSSNSSSASATSSAHGVVNIGVLVPLTGFAALDGQEMLGGAQLAAQEINANGGVNGYQFKVYAADEGSGGTQMINAFNQLVLQNNVSYIVGPEYSGDFRTLAPYLLQRQVVAFTPTASLNGLFTNATLAHWMFRVTANDTIDGTSFATFINATHAKTVYAVGDDIVFVHEDVAAIQKYAPTLGASVIGTDFYSTSTTDFSSEILRIANAKPDAVLLFATGSDVITFVNQYKQNPQMAKVPLIEVNGSPLEDPTVVASMLSSNPHALDYISVIGPYYTQKTTNRTTPFANSYYQTFGKYPNLGYAGRCYDAVYTIANAIKNAGTTNKEAVITALGHSHFVGATGIITFTSTHELNFKPGVYVLPIYEFLPGGQIVVYYPPETATGSFVPPA